MISFLQGGADETFSLSSKLSPVVGREKISKRERENKKIRRKKKVRGRVKWRGQFEWLWSKI
jgi:hypothetical protein